VSRLSRDHRRQVRLLGFDNSDHHHNRRGAHEESDKDQVSCVALARRSPMVGGCGVLLAVE
jgi:hypothetical protein